MSVIGWNLKGANARNNPAHMSHLGMTCRNWTRRSPVQDLGSACHPSNRRCDDASFQVIRDKRTVDGTIGDILRGHCIKCNSTDSDDVMPLHIGPSYMHVPTMRSAKSNRHRNPPPRNPSSSLPAIPLHIHDGPPSASKFDRRLPRELDSTSPRISPRAGWRRNPDVGPGPLRAHGSAARGG